MRERIFNIFVFSNSGVITEYGLFFHKKSGSEEELLAFLRSRVSEDVKKCRRFPLPSPISNENYVAIRRMNQVVNMANEGLSLLRAPRNVLFCATVVIDGKIEVEGIDDLSCSNLYVIDARGITNITEDYLRHYSSPNGFRIRELLEDEFISAIQVLVDNGKYISALKLIMSMLDTFAYLEYGDEKGVFTNWLDSFCNLSALKVTSEELWELRSSLLHMTNLRSRKVRSGAVYSLVPSFPHSYGHYAVRGVDPTCEKNLNVGDFWKVVLRGADAWTRHMKTEGRILQFIERYDEVISDTHSFIPHQTA